jgi:uncharacterized membrane protein
MLVGTCRVWRGLRTGGAFTVLSPNFDTLGSGTCSGSEVNQVRALAVAGLTDLNGSSVIYATTSGLGPLDGPLSTPTGGHVWVTTDATAGIPAFADVTNNGPQGTINPNQFPISGVATDSTDVTGATAYVTVMGFTGGPGHVWKTTSAGAAWIDFTANLPDSPVNAVVVYPPMSQVYVATDVGVFASSTSSPSWTELGPIPSGNNSGFLPNVAVTALGIFASGGQQLLRASTYGRGIWQFNLVTTPSFQLSISNSPQTVLAGQTATFHGSAAALNGYASSVALTCTTGVTAPPATCTPTPATLTPAMNTPFTLTAGGAVGDYYFNLQGTGSDSNHIAQHVGVVLHVTSPNPDFTLSEPIPFPTVNVGSITTSGPISVTAVNGFTGAITLTCSLVSGSGSCSVTPSTVTSIPSAPNVTVNATALNVGSYQLVVQGTSGSITHTLVVPFNVGDYQLSGPQSLTLGVGSQGPANLTLTPSTFYVGKINATCDASALPGATCTVNPANPITVNPGSPVSLVATITVPNNTTLGTYNINVNTRDTTGVPTHNLTVSLTVTQNFHIISSTASQTVTAGQTTGSYSLAIQPVGSSFNSAVTLSCSAGLPPAAQCAFTPSTPVTPGSSSASVGMTISTTASTAAGTYPITVTGTSGSLSQSAIVSLIVTTTNGGKDFQLAVTQPFPAGVDAGSQPTAQVSVTPNYSGSINVTCNATAISGGQCTVTPPNPVPVTASTPATLTVALNLPNNAAPGTYNINLSIADSSGQPSHSIQLPLTVIADFSVSSATPSQTVTAGQTTGAYQLTVAPNPPGSSFPGAIALSCPSGLPAGAQCLFNPSTPITPGSTAVQVVMSISTTSVDAGKQASTKLRPVFYAACSLLPGMVVIWFVGRRPGKLVPMVCRRMLRRMLLMRMPLKKALLSSTVLSSLAMILLLLLTSSLPSCSGVSSSGGGTCSSVPTVPAGLAASSTTSTGTALSWTPSSATSGCSVTYSVFQNSTAIATATKPTYPVTGLQPATLYNFEVSAIDSFGASAPSPAVSVTTLSGGNGGQVYNITVSGASPGTPASAAQSARVILVVH